jgi:hypothetical protein
MTVHNHGTEDGPGLSCPERSIDGKLRGACMERLLAEAWEAGREVGLTQDFEATTQITNPYRNQS